MDNNLLELIGNIARSDIKIQLGTDKSANLEDELIALYKSYGEDKNARLLIESVLLRHHFIATDEVYMDLMPNVNLGSALERDLQD